MSLRVSGCAVPYGVAARLGDDDFLTRFEPGAFAASIAARAVECWVNHNRAARVGSQARRTLALYETTRGLFFSVSITDSRWGDILADIHRVGLLYGASVGIGRARSARWAAGIRVIADAPLLELSLCIGQTRPAFPTWARVETARAA